MTKASVGVLAGLAAFATLGCDVLNSGPYWVTPAEIDLASSEWIVPDSVDTDVPFTIVVPTREGACILDRTEVVTVGRGITVELFQVYTRQECIQIGVLVNREIEVVWPHPGPFILVVAGQSDEQPVAVRFEVSAPLP